MRIARKSGEKWERQALVILLVISMVLSSNYSIGEAKTKLIKNTGKVTLKEVDNNSYGNIPKKEFGQSKKANKKTAATTDTKSGFYWYRVVNGEATITDYTATGGNVVIPETIDGYSVTAIDSYAFAGKGIMGVEFPKTIKKIGGSAFSGCVSLKTVLFTENTTNGYEVEIGSSAFSGDKLLSEITFSENVSKIGSHAFKDCAALSKVQLPEKLKGLGGYAFSGTNITSITIPCTMESVTDWGASPFCGASHLKEVIFEEGMETIPAYILCMDSNDTCKVTRVIIPGSVIKIGGCAFSYCKGLTGDIGAILPDALEEIGKDAFSNCTNIENVRLALNHLQRIESFAFSGCTKVETVEFPKSIQNIGGSAFSGCVSLKTVLFTENTINGYEVEIGSSVFSGDKLLSEITFSENVSKIGSHAFKDCATLSKVQLPEKLKGLGGYAFSGTNIASITIPRTMERVTDWGASPFCGAGYLKEVIFEEGMETIPAYILRMENDDTCEVMRVIIPDSVAKIGGEAFYNCNQFTIYGYEGSYAQTYADENNIPFRIYTGEFEDVITTKVTGTLSAVNLNDFTVTISGTSYEVMDEFDMSAATDILNNHTCKVVVASLENGKVARMKDVTTLIEAHAQIKADIKELIYQNKSFNKDKYTITVDLSTVVAAGYSDLDIQKAGNIDGLSVHFDNLKLLLSSDGFYFSKTGILNSKKVTELAQELNVDIAYGEYKTYTFDVYVDNKYVPDLVSANIVTEMTVMSGKKSISNRCSVFVGNIDLQNKNTASKNEGKESTKEVNKAKKELEKLANKINFLYDDTPIRTCFSSNPSNAVDKVNQCLSAWIAAIMANASIAQESKGTLDDVLKKLGIDEKSIRENIMKKVFAKLGISLSSGADIDFAGKKASTLIKMKHPSGKIVKMYFSLDMGNYSLNKKGTFGGFGTLSYYLVDEKGRRHNPLGNGIITYVDFKSFSDGIKSVAESSIKSLYNEVWGNDANKVVSGIVKEINGETTNRIVELLTSDTVTKIISKKVGTFSSNVFNILESSTNNYTKNISVHCPVDVYLFDDSGKLCGEIINNEINEDYNDVFMYVVDDEKFIYLTDASYTIKFVGNDIGTMNYEIIEYVNGEYLRTIAYNDISLEHNKTYYSSIPESVLLDNVVPRPISGDSEIIEATEDDIQDYLGTEIRVENVDIDKKNIGLGIGESTVLTAIISPDDATNQLVTWKSENSNVATVDDNGKVTAVSIGSTTIIATAEDGEYTATCIVTVQKKDDSSNPTVPSFKPSTLPSSKPSVTNRPYRPTTTNIPSVTDEPTASPDVVPTLSPMPTISPTVTPIVVPTVEPTPVITETPEPSLEPTEIPESTVKPTAKPKPTTKPDSEKKNNSKKKLKKGSKVTDKKTKAVYKITGIGKNKTAEYVKSTKKNPVSVSIPASMKLEGKTYKITSVGKSAFKNSKKLKTIKIGKNVKKIGNQAFFSCTKLTNVTLGKNVTAIGENAFNKCTALVIITIPAKVKKIGSKAFYQCKNLRYILVKTKKLTAKNVGSNAFGKGAAKLRVKTDKNKWKLYARIFIAKGMSVKALYIIDPVKLVL